jgi:formylmethanofuran dehydrogenase subunit E
MQADVLREAMALLFAPKGSFQLGKVDDAAECFESIIEHVHCAACGIPEAEGGRDQSCGYPPCPSCAQFKVFVFILTNLLYAIGSLFLLQT